MTKVSVKDMPYVTVEQAAKYRLASLHVEAERDYLLAFKENITKGITHEDLWWLQDCINSILRPNGGSHAAELDRLHYKLKLFLKG